MSNITCPSCYKKISKRDTICPHCGHKRVGVITINKILYAILFLIIVIIGAIILLLPAKSPELITAIEFAEPPIKYKVAKEWRPNNEYSRIGLNLAVNKNITKEDASLLIDYLSIKYQKFTNVFISVFDNEDVAQNYALGKLSQDQIDRHFIVQLVRNDYLEIDDVNWKRKEFMSDEVE